MQQTEYIQAVAGMRRRIVRQAAAMLSDADEAEDVAQEALLKLWSLRERFETEADIGRAATVVTRNPCLNIQRHKARHRMLAMDGQEPATEATAETDMISKEGAARLEAIAACLPDKYRLILEMRNTEGLSYREIAAAIGSTESSVRGMASKARMMLMMGLRRGKGT